MSSPSGSFVMVGSRDVLAYYEGSTNIEPQIVAIERSVCTNARLTFDVCKALIETVCKTLLRDRGKEPTKTDSVLALLKQTTMHLSFLPATHRARPELRESMERTLNGLMTVLNGLASLRNAEGLASHGPEAFEPSLDDLHALMAARATDAIVHFLVGCHRAYPDGLKTRPLEYQDNEPFNKYVDDLHGEVLIFDAPYRPSEVLFEVDDDAYREELRNYLATPPADIPGPTTEELEGGDV